MKLNHLNLTVSDVPGTRHFLEKYFGLHSTDPGDNNQIAQLRDDGEMQLTLLKFGGEEVQYPASFHIGFIQETEAQVNEINEHLKADGFDVPAPRQFHGSWTFYFGAPGGFVIEVQTEPKITSSSFKESDIRHSNIAEQFKAEGK